MKSIALNIKYTHTGDFYFEFPVFVAVSSSNHNTFRWAQSMKKIYIDPLLHCEERKER